MGRFRFRVNSSVFAFQYLIQENLEWWKPRRSAHFAAIPRLLNNFCGAFPNLWSKFAQSACEQSLCTVSICICWLLQTWFSSRCLLLITSQIFRFSKRYFHCTAQLWVTTFYFSLWFLLLWWRSAQVSSNTLAMTEFVILTSEHS